MDILRIEIYVIVASVDYPFNLFVIGLLEL